MLHSIGKYLKFYVFFFFLGCNKTFWGKNCSQSCSKHCINQHCFPGNGSCVWGCECPGICNALCLDGCKENRTGLSCNKCKQFHINYFSIYYNALMQVVLGVQIN